MSFWCLNCFFSADFKMLKWLHFVCLVMLLDTYDMICKLFLKYLLYVSSKWRRIGHFIVVCFINSDLVLDLEARLGMTLF